MIIIIISRGRSHLVNYLLGSQRRVSREGNILVDLLISRVRGHNGQTPQAAHQLQPSIPEQTNSEPSWLWTHTCTLWLYFIRSLVQAACAVQSACRESRHAIEGVAGIQTLTLKLSVQGEKRRRAARREI